MKLTFATGNRGKLREASEILGGEFEIVSSASAGITEDIPETGSTLEENSRMKACYVMDRTGTDCFADDTGLEVRALGGAPGVYSARYAGPGHDSAANIVKLLKELDGIGDRSAAFRTAVTLLFQGREYVFRGEVKGRIGTVLSGEGGFGYDPVFIPDEIPAPDGSLVPNVEELTMAQLTEEQKNAISHRGRALRAMAAFLKKGRP